MTVRMPPTGPERNDREQEAPASTGGAGLRPKLAFFGHFGLGNFGNESTLQAILYHCRRELPNADLMCICTGPETVAEDYGIAAVPITRAFVKPWRARNPLARMVRKLFVGVPSELYRWLRGVRTLRDTDALIIPGTGLLTDAYSLFSWGPYNMFKWSVIAKVCRCKVLFVSVGAGPLYGIAGRWLVKLALSLADYRSYRDESTSRYLQGIGFRAQNDRVYPDLAFSLPKYLIPSPRKSSGRTVVGLGLMEYAGRYSVAKPSNATYLAYLENLVLFAQWLLAHDYDIKLLIGDIGDEAVKLDFKALLKERSPIYDERRVSDDPEVSVVGLLSQLAGTDIVVATRFHNVLLALLLNKPVISISFHHKCVSLMRQMGLAEYHLDINELKASDLIDSFRTLENNAASLRKLIHQKADECRSALDEQYELIGKCIEPRVLN